MSSGLWRAAEFKADIARRCTVYKLQDEHIIRRGMIEEIHTKSSSEIGERKSGMRADKSSSQAPVESTIVYRIAATTVALAAGSASRIRAWMYC